MKIYSQRTFMPFDNRDSYGNPHISPLTPKSIIPTNNVLTIQDILNQEQSIKDFYPNAGGEWSPGEDVDKNYREEGDDYKRQEKDLAILSKMMEQSNIDGQKWLVKVKGGAKEFSSFETAMRYLKKNQLPFSYVTRIAQKKEENNRVQVIADSLNKTFMVESMDYQEGVMEKGSAFCVGKNMFLTCAHVVKKYNKNETDHKIEDFHKNSVFLIHGSIKKEATIEKIDLKQDIALLKSEIESGYFEFDTEAMVGDEILAVGSPHGYENNVSFGYVGGLDKKVYFYDSAPNYMFLDLSVFPGNSGGPVVKVDNGKCVGLVTLIIASEGVYGLNAALPANKIVDFLR